MLISVIIPAYNEEKSIGKVLAKIPKSIVNEIIVVNNNSTDNTVYVAETNGVTVLLETKKGYGAACLKGIDYLKSCDVKPDIVVFIDADYSDYPEEMPFLIKPILDANFDLVIGSRDLGNREKGSMTIPQIFGNWLATNLIHLFFRVKFTDLGPFRAIKWSSLLALEMKDKTFGWTVEMQVKAAKKNMKCTEVPVNYRRRIGHSKISGTVKGTLLAGYKILYTIFKNI